MLTCANCESGSDHQTGSVNCVYTRRKYVIGIVAQAYNTSMQEAEAVESPQS